MGERRERNIKRDRWGGREEKRGEEMRERRETGRERREEKER